MYSLSINRRASFLTSGIVAALLLGGVAGCGGGGSAPGAPSAGATGRLTVFATDAFADDYDQVWVKIHRVELLDASGAAETVFDDPTGVSLNLKTLHDAAGQRFALLTHATGVRSRLHTQVRVTIDDTTVLFPAGGSTGQAVPLSDDISRDGSGHPTLVFPLSGGPRNLGSGNSDLSIDFDLNTFRVAVGKVTPELREGGHDSLGMERQETSEFTGTIANLAGSAPDQTFTLTGEKGASFTVQTNAATRLFNSGGTPEQTLANGSAVSVRGTFDVTTDRFVATGIKREDSAGEVEVEGVPSAGDAAARFTLSVKQVRGFLPTQATVSVTTTASTVFGADRGLRMTAAEFYAALPGATGIEAEGSYDAAANTLTVSKVKLNESEDNGSDNGSDNGNDNDNGGIDG